MRNSKAKILVWCNDAPNQKALVNKIADEFEVAGLVLERRLPVKLTMGKFISKVRDRMVFKSIGGAWQNLMKFYAQKFTSWPAVTTLSVNNINTAGVIEFSREINPDLVIVSGTSLIKEDLLALKPRIGIINLHTGLSPYVKGGPNCTNWCIANNEWHLIGNTIMWINKGIDSGNIITTKVSDISGCKTLFDIHKKVMEDAHDLYISAIRYLVNNQPPYISVPQKEIAEGRLYLTKMWTVSARKALLKNLKSRKNTITGSIKPKTIELPA